MHQSVHLHRRVPYGALVMLERSAAKVARCVLRGLRHEVVSVFVMRKYSDITPCATTGTLPGRAVGAIGRYEAPGTM